MVFLGIWVRIYLGYDNPVIAKAAILQIKDLSALVLT